jgi:hypothetical protein
MSVSSNGCESIFSNPSSELSVLKVRASKRFLRRRLADLVNQETNATTAAKTMSTTMSIPTMIGGFCDRGGAVLASSTLVDTGSGVLVLDPEIAVEERVVPAGERVLSNGGRLADMGDTTRERTGEDAIVCTKLLD